LNKYRKNGISFGPVPSRRLGKSVGINNIPPKTCTYSCIYCQLGRTKNIKPEPQSFYSLEEIFNNVKKRIEDCNKSFDNIDYLTFIADGEPTLDINLKREIESLRSLGIKIAVLTNGSLIWKENVAEALSAADWVSLKIDTLDKTVWQKINRPHNSLNLELIKMSMLAFARNFKGTLTTDTMLIKNINDSKHHIKLISEFLSQLNPSTAYLAIPTRPPAENWIEIPKKTSITYAHQIMQSMVTHVEFLTSYESNTFSSTGNIEDDLLSITSVHPMRKEAITALLSKVKADWSVIDALVQKEHLHKIEYQDQTFYIKKWPKNKDLN
jgi:wyosine [tRNA(Phe)-imidazoG37] synthetase (radical SAM superfamily)